MTVSRNNRFLCFAFCATLVCASPARPQDYVENTALCERVAKTPIPEADLPRGADRNRLAGCVSTTLYYARTYPGDATAARLCAFSERASATPPELGGAGVLMMIYANAKAVGRNMDLARRFACEFYVAQSVLDVQLRNIDQLQSTLSADDEVDICGGFGSGHDMGACAQMHLKALAPAQAAGLQRLAAGLDPAELAAFDALRRTARIYEESHVAHEVDAGGSAHAQLAADEQIATQAAFFDLLDAYHSGQLPRGDERELAQAEDALAYVLARVLRLAAPTSPDDERNSLLGTVVSQGIERTQLAWRDYRDALANFATLQYPRAPRSAFLLQVTIERTRTLQELIGPGEAGVTGLRIRD